MTVFAEVVFPLPIDRTFLYRIPPALEGRAAAGRRVVAPFGRRTMTGVIVSLAGEPSPGSYDIKDIREIPDDAPPFPEGFLAFSRELAARYLSAWGEVLQAALPPTLAPQPRKKVSLTPEGAAALEDGGLGGRDRELALLLKAGPKSLSFLAGKLGVRDPAPRIRKLEGRGLVTTDVSAPGPRPSPGGTRERQATQLEFLFDEAGQTGLGAVERAIGTGRPASFYLMGSAAAREAAYTRLVRRAAGAGRKILFLTPDVSRARAWAGKGIGGKSGVLALLHGRLPRREREEEWRKIVEGRADGVIGPRSALLAPLAGVGLIVMDDESDETYDQPEGRLFETRGGAGLRAEAEGAVLVCGSSSPSVEAYHAALAGRNLVKLDSEPRRFAVTVVDDRGQKGLLSAGLEARLRERLGKGEPALVFINRLGYAPYTFCSKCGRSPHCPRCDISLEYHKKADQWFCRYCDFRKPASPLCPDCGGALVRKRGRGIEALEEELVRLFPGVPAARFDSEEAGRESEQDRVIEDFKRGRIPLLLATNLLARRTDFPKVPFAAILSPETLLGLSDYGASQKVYQAIARMMEFVADDPTAEALIQTSNPSHFSVRAAAAGDYARFYEAEIEIRKLMNYPPFAGLAEVILEGRDLRALARKSRELASRLAARGGGGIEVLGPAMAAVGRIRGQFRVQVVLKSADRHVLVSTLREVLDKLGAKKTVRLS